MKQIIVKITVIAACLLIMSAGISVGEDKKVDISQDADKKELPISVYIKRFKLKFIMGNVEQGMEIIDEMFKEHGHTADGLYYKCVGYGNLIDDTDKRKKKIEYLEHLFAYSDTLNSFCLDKQIKKKYRHECKKYMAQVDSLKVKCRSDIYGD